MRALTPTVATLLALAAADAFADPLACNMSGYKAAAGLTAASADNVLTATWAGDRNQELRLRLSIENGTPTIRELAIRKSGAAWQTLASHVVPDYRVVSGLRRMSNQQMTPLRGLGVELTSEVVDKYRWDPFWDAPLDQTPTTGRGGNPPPADGVANQPGLPRKPEEIKRAAAIYRATSCAVKTNGARLEIQFPGVQLGVFSGTLQYSIFKGSNLIQQEILATTSEPWVAYKYDAGLEGLSTQGARVVWRDIASNWQDYRFGGVTNDNDVPLKTTGRIVIAERSGAGSIVAFPPPHTFFWAREVAINLGYNSDVNFLVMPNQEYYNSPLGGHTDLLFAHAVYWTERRAPGQPLVDEDPKYGKVYHIGSADDLMEMARREDVLINMPHPRTKGSTGYPDAIKDRPFFNDPHYQGIGFRWGMGLDRSEERLCEYRCQPLIDDMNNWVADKPEPPKYLLSISEVRHQQPGDEIYASAPVTYVKLDTVPKPDESAAVIHALMRGDSFVTSGEVLIPSYAIRGTGNQRTIVADVEWTFPLTFVEVISGDGTKSDRQVISTTDLAPMGSHHFEIPFNAAGKKWVRFAAWDSAGNGAMAQPVKLAFSRP